MRSTMQDLGPGKRMLDLGCGWGALLNFIRDAAAAGTGVTLSAAQAAACRRHGLDVRLFDARRGDRDSFGAFDAVASLGAFEHFCSPAEFQAGRQEQVYRGLFARVASVLPDRGRFYLQTMVFGRNMIRPRRSTSSLRGFLRAARTRGTSLSWGANFPGPGCPSGREQIVALRRAAFRLVDSSNGRLDYIETIRQWNARIGAPSLRKTLFKLALLPRWLTSADFRLAFTSGVSANKVCFERELLDHYRLVFEKRE